MNTKNSNSSAKTDGKDIKTASSNSSDQKSAKDNGKTAIKKSPAKK